jgi:putative beta-barrel porin BBP2
VRSGWAALLLLAVAAGAGAQEGPAGVAETPGATGREAPGMFRLGPIYLTPSFRIWSLGVDTNVFYTATNRRSDFIAHGGPGLEMVVPLHGALKLRADGTIGYLYFARTESQRRITGSALGRLAYEGDRLVTGAQYGYDRTFNRIGIEVDRRVEVDEQHAQADLRYDLGARFHLGLRGRAEFSDIAEGQLFLGANPRQNLTRDTFDGVVTLGYALTPKTSLIVEADHQVDRFTFTPERDTDSNRLGGGLTISSSSYLSGDAVGGARSIRVTALPDQDRIVPYARVDLRYHFGPRTQLAAFFTRDVEFSAFTVDEGELPTLMNQRYGLRLEKGLWGRLDLRLFGSITELESDAPALVDTGDGFQRIRRNDRGAEAGADLGYAFWAHLRIGLSANWSERRSTISDLGVEGLLLGATINYVP